MSNKQTTSILKAAVAGFCVMCLALGLARFAYTPLLPEMVAKHWLTETVASYIGSANFLGYLIGAFLAKRLLKFNTANFWIKTNLVLCTLSLAACIIHWNTAWLLCWRTIAGFSGAVLMVLTPPIIYRSIHKHHISLVSGIMFGGIGAGIIFGSLIVPALEPWNISYTWGVIACFGLILTVIATALLPTTTVAPTATAAPSSSQYHWSLPITLAFLAYILFGYGAVPHLLYMVAYIEEALKGTVLVANIGWFIYGIGNTIGSPIFGYISKHIGMKRALAISYLMMMLSIAILFLNHHPWIGLASYLLNGLVANSVVSLSSSYLTTLAPHHQQTHYWGIFTIFVALAQTSGSAIMANWMGNHTGYILMFSTSALAMLIATLLVFFSPTPKTA